MKQPKSEEKNQTEAKGSGSRFNRTVSNLIGLIVASPVLPFVFLLGLCIGIFKGRRKS